MFGVGVASGNHIRINTVANIRIAIHIYAIRVNTVMISSSIFEYYSPFHDIEYNNHYSNKHSDP